MKLEIQQKSIDALPGMLEQRMEEVLERKGVAAGNITRDLLRDEIRALLQDVGLQRSKPGDSAQVAPKPTRVCYSWGGKFHNLPKTLNFRASIRWVHGNYGGLVMTGVSIHPIGLFHLLI